MAKAKVSKPVEVKKPAMSKVKEGRVTKPEATKSKVDTAKVAKLDTKKKSKKAATPSSSSSSSSSSGSESDSGSGSSDDDDEKKKSGSSSSSGSSSGSESDSESEIDQSKLKKSAAPKVNGNAKLTNGDVSEGSESDDEDESDDEAVPPKATKARGETTASAAAKDHASDESSGSSDDSSDSESDESASEKEQATAGATAKAGSSDSDSESGSSGSDSSSSSESDDEEEEKAAPAAVAKKRKAEVAEPAVAQAAKKSKTVTETEESAGIKSLFVGNLSWNIDEEWLSREFGEHGEVVGCRIITDRDSGRSKGYGYVDFSTAADAATAHAARKDTELDGRTLNVDFSHPRGDAKPNDRANARAAKFGDSTSPPSDTLWIGNLPWGSDADSLRAHCEEHGAVASVRIPTDRETGEIKGFGYVSFASIDEAKAAHAALKGSDFNGRPMRVDFSGPKPESSGFDGGRGGGRGGGFRGGRGGGDRGGFRGGRGGGDFRGGRGGRGAPRGGRGNSYNRGGIGDFSGSKVTF